MNRLFGPPARLLQAGGNVIGPAADANRVVKRYFAVNNPVLVLIGQAQQIRGQLQGYGDSMMEVSITEPGFVRQRQPDR